MRIKILLKLEEKNMSIRDLAKELNITPPTISNFINSKTECNFETVYHIVKYLFSDYDERYDLYKEYVETSIQKTRNLKVGLEIFMMEREFDFAQMIIDKLLNSNNKKDKEYGEIYQAQINFRLSDMKDKENQKEFNKFLTNLIPKSIETEILKHKMWCYYYLSVSGNLTQILEEVDTALTKIENVSDTVLKKIYLSWAYHSKTCAGFRLANNKERSEEIVSYALLANDFIIHNGYPLSEVAIAANYYQITLCYFFYDYKKAYEYGEKCIDIFNRNNLSFIAESMRKETLDLLDIHWDKSDYMPLEDVKVPERAYLEVKRGKKQTALEILKDCREDDAYVMFYRALALDDIPLLCKSLAQFLKQEDFLFSNFPREELLKRGLEKGIVDAFYFLKEGVEPNPVI